jgi:hypothetical protein
VKLKRGINLTKESKKRKIKRMNTTLKKKNNTSQIEVE